MDENYSSIYILDTLKVFSILLTSLKVAISWVLEHEFECITEYIFWTVHCLVMKHGLLIGTVMDNAFRKYFAWFEGLGFKSILHHLVWNQFPIFTIELKMSWKYFNIVFIFFLISDQILFWNYIEFEREIKSVTSFKDSFKLKRFFHTSQANIWQKGLAAEVK